MKFGRAEITHEERLRHQKLGRENAVQRRKHAELQSAVVKAALEWHRAQSHRDVTRPLVDLWNAAWALEKFETEGRE